jgi:hypothetical protein
LRISVPGFALAFDCRESRPMTVSCNWALDELAGSLAGTIGSALFRSGLFLTEPSPDPNVDFVSETGPDRPLKRTLAGVV